MLFFPSLQRLPLFYIAISTSQTPNGFAASAICFSLFYDPLILLPIVMMKFSTHRFIDIRSCSCECVCVLKIPTNVNSVISRTINDIKYITTQRANEWMNERKMKLQKQRRTKRTPTENLSISTATASQIYQFQQMCSLYPELGQVCLLCVCVCAMCMWNGERKSEPKHRKQTIKARTQETIMEQVNGGSSNTEKIYRNLFFRWSYSE